MAENNSNLWAPWRMEYIETLGDDVGETGCFLCEYWSDPDRDTQHRVVRRTAQCMVVLNRFPYTNGHMLIAPGAHVGSLEELDDGATSELMLTTRETVRLLKRTISPDGFNIGINLGRCAGAGLPDHVHAHVVPRWGGDTNYMAVVADVRVIPQSLDALHQKLVDGAKQLGFD